MSAPAAALGRPPRRRRLPFSPWHLVLIPATIVLILPFAWMLITSVETPAEALHFPPILTPHVIGWATTRPRCGRRRSAGSS
jgi:multiple sugar transport system permease protein